MSSREDEILGIWRKERTELRLVLSSDGLYCEGIGSIRTLNDEEMTIDGIGLGLTVKIRDAKKVYSDPADAPAVIRGRVTKEQICQVELQLSNLTVLFIEPRKGLS
jgi:hypothetical protein